MRTFLRVASFLLAIALFLSLTVAFAQEDGEIIASGSRAVIGDILLPAITASDSAVNLSPQISGTSNGIAAFCSGEAQIAGTTRPLTLEEEDVCKANDVAFNEYLVGYEIVALIAHPELDFVSCLTTRDLNTLLAPSAASNVIDWQATGLTERTDIPLNIFLPNTESVAYAMVDEMVDGFGLRSDAAVVANVADEVAATPGSIGVTTLAAVQARDDVQIVALNTTDVNTCASPSAETVSDRRYGAANRLLLYVSTALSENPSVSDALAFLFSEDNVNLISEAGYTAPDAGTQETNQQILSGELESGRQFSRELTTFSIPGNVIGAVRIEGSSNPVNYLADLDRQFTSTYPSVNIELDTFGESAASDAFCGGDSDIDILALSEPLSNDLQTTCEENKVTYLDFELGKQAVVLLGNADDAFTECLTADQVRTIWAATSTDTVTKWNQVNDSFLEQDIYTFAPSLGTSNLADLFLKQSGNPVLPLRTDITERNNDPLYRVAAVSNASGTITFMNWTSYQDLEDSKLDRVHLVAIDNGGGCVEPSEETIQSGEYPFVENSLLLVKTSALGRAEVQSVLWYMFSDENYHLIEDAGFSGITLAQLPGIRDDLQDQFAEANAQAVTAGGDVTGAPVFDPLARPNTSENFVVPETETTPPVDESTPPVDDQ